jgi:hypothetical protein
MTTNTSAASTIAALLIDPVRAEARRVALTLHDHALDLSELYRLLGCDIVERGPFDDRHMIWADENGWDEAAGFTVIDGGENAIAGRFLIIGETEKGEPQDVAANVAPLLARLVCHRCLFEAEFVTRSGGDEAGFVVETRLQGVRPCIDKRPPRWIGPES